MSNGARLREGDTAQFMSKQWRDVIG